jgi:hypothetical protein
MASRTSSRAARQVKKEGWGPKHRPPTFEATTLLEDLPIGTYRVDTVAQELISAGASVLFSHPEFVRGLRAEMNEVARFAMANAKEHFIRYPKLLRETKRLYQDLPKIKRLLQRNEDLGCLHLYLTTLRTDFIRRPRLRDQPDEVYNLVTALWRASKTITVFQNNFKPRVKPGNHDPLTRGFIDALSKFWARRHWREQLANEEQLFMRLLVAAWRDFELPTKDQSGGSLEEWLADRVRKQFPDGIRNACSKRQAEKLTGFEAWLRLECGFRLTDFQGV